MPALKIMGAHTNRDAPRRGLAALTAAPAWLRRRGALERRPVVASFLLLVVLVGACYRAWLTTGLITAGDFPYFTQAHLSEGTPVPSLWDASSSTGGYNIIDAPMFPLAMAAGALTHLGLGWSGIERLLWIFPAVVTPCLSTYALAMLLFARRVTALVAALAAVLNSYIYLLYEGGQFGVAMGYGCLPLVVFAFVHGQRRARVRDVVPTGLCMAVQAVYDIRSTYLSFGVLLLYALMCSHMDVAVYPNEGSDGGGKRVRALPGARSRLSWHAWRGRVHGLPHIAVALIILAVLQSWWLLPAVFVQGPALPPSYTMASAVAPLSLMHLSNGIALFHPFWFANNLSLAPINPLFFVVPVLVFGVLLYRHRDRRVLFLTVVALLAIFLVKGDNEPAGSIYDWLFLHFPGFSLFRDASKFYQPLAFAYALLLGVAADRCYEAVTKCRGSGMGLSGAFNRVMTCVALLPVMLLLVLVVFPATPALFGAVRGTFAANPVPDDYARFNASIDSQSDFFRVLWVPARPRFATYSTLHPALDADQLAPCCVPRASTLTTGRPWAWLSQSKAARTLQELSVRYIVVPELDTVSADVIGRPNVIGGVTPPVDAPEVAIQAALPMAHEHTLGHLHIFELGFSYPLLYMAPETNVSTARADDGYNLCVAGTVCVAARPRVGVRDVAARPTRNGARVRAYAGSVVGYDIDVDVAALSQPFYLVFNQTYDPSWLAYVEPKNADGFPWFTLFQTPLAAREHVSANGYANAWLLHGAQRPGSYRIILVYWPEWLAILGVTLAAFAVLGYGAAVAVRRVCVRPSVAHLGRDDLRPPRKSLLNRLSRGRDAVHTRHSRV